MDPVFLLWFFEQISLMGSPVPYTTIWKILHLIPHRGTFRKRKDGSICFYYQVSSLKSIAIDTLVRACKSHQLTTLFKSAHEQHTLEEEKLAKITQKFGELYRKIPKVYLEAIRRQKENDIYEGNPPRIITPLFIKSFAEQYKGFWEDEQPTNKERTKCMSIADNMHTLREYGDELKANLTRFWIVRFSIFAEMVVPFIRPHKDASVNQKMQFYLSMPKDFRDLLEETEDKGFIVHIFGSITQLSGRKTSRLVRCAIEQNIMLSDHVEEVMKFRLQPHRKNVKYTDWRQFW